MNDLLNKLHHGDCLEGMKRIARSSVKCILTDPPYLYLKGQKLEREFDEQLFFSECKRILKDDGFIVLFGRGSSFYRWNYMLDQMGFVFKEEIVWDKSYVSSPVLPINRVHETISIYTKKNGVVNECRNPYIEEKKYNTPSIVNDIKRIIAAIKRPTELDDLLYFVEHGDFKYAPVTKNTNSGTTVQTRLADRSRAVGIFKSIVMGLKEKSIIKVQRDHYNTIHPTQKPVRLIERLLALLTKEGDTVCDFFAGSGAIPIACINTNRNWMAWEIDQEYYDDAKARIDTVLKEKAEKTIKEPDLFTNAA